MRISLAFFLVCLAGSTQAQSASLPDAPSSVLAAATVPTAEGSSSSSQGADQVDLAAVEPTSFPFDLANVAELDSEQATQPAQTSNGSAQKKQTAPVPVDANGNPIPLERQQPQRILGFMPNFRSVSAGSKPHPPGWNYNFKVATRQAFDYSSFLFLGITSLSAEGINSHPVLGKGVGGFYAYTWRGFLDKTDGTYLQAWLLPSLLHEDTRFYPLGKGHPIAVRALYVISRQAVTRTYSGSQTPNIAGLGGKVLTQVISRYYYPTGATDFSVLATKFAYSAMRDIAFSSVREFYPDIAAHYIRKHRAKVAAASARDAQPAPATP